MPGKNAILKMVDYPKEVTYMDAKRIISWILTIAIVLGLAATGIVAAFAAEKIVIDDVEIGVENFTVGKSTTDISIVLPDEANYTLKSCSVEAEDETPVTGTLEAGTYGIYIVLEPKDGYVFDTTGLGWGVDGKGKVMSASREIKADSATFFAKFTITDPANTIDYIEVTVTGMEIGKNTADVKVSVPEDANYTAQLWMDGVYDLSDGFDPFAGVLGRDLYRVDIEVTPKAGYCFLYDDAQFKVNAEGHSDAFALTRETTTYFLGVEFDLRTPIDKVDITVTGMEKGKKAGDVKVTIPQGANYVLDSFTIADGDWNTFTGSFANDLYTNYICLKPAEGYCFTEDTEVTVNGGKPSDLYAQTESLEVEHALDLRTPITRVELPALPAAPKAGDTVTAPNTASPEGKHYSFMGAWTLGYDMLPPGAQFENDKVYMYQYVVEPDSGYRFADTVTVTVGGKAYSDNIMKMYDRVVVGKNYAIGNVKLLDKLAFSGAAPTAGNAPGTITSTGTGYKPLEVYWVVADTANADSFREPGKTFQEGEYVFMIAFLKPDQGYRELDINAKVLFNGKEHKIIMVEAGETNDGYLAAVVVEFGQLKKAGNPDTGDGTPVAVLTALTVASILGMGVLLSRRKTV